MKRRVGRIAVRLGVLAVLVYVGFGAVLALSQTSLIFPRHMTGPGLSDAEVPAFVERWWVSPAPSDAPGVKVEAWFILGDGRSATSPGPAVVLLHGNGELIDDNLQTAEMYRRMGISVLMPEYRGYGRSGGTPGQRVITGDLLKFHAMLLARSEVDASRLIYHGESLGTGFASVLAGERPPRVVILNSPFKSVASMAARFLVPGFLVRSPLRSDEVLAKDIAPVLIFHGVYDHVVPIEQGRALAKVTPRAVFVELDCGHNDLPPSWPAYRERIAVFLEEYGVTGGVGTPR
ncbi:MAG: alpha/beta hydrolase [Phycisphaerales bacterium]